MGGLHLSDYCNTRRCRLYEVVCAFLWSLPLSFSLKIVDELYGSAPCAGVLSGRRLCGCLLHERVSDAAAKPQRPPAHLGVWETGTVCSPFWGSLLSSLYQRVSAMYQRFLIHRSRISESILYQLCIWPLRILRVQNSRVLSPGFCVFEPNMEVISSKYG